MNERRKLLERKAIRGILIGAFSLAVISMIAALLPGTSKYDGTWLVETAPAAGWSYVLFVLGVSLPAIAVWKHPRPMALFAYGMLIWIVAIVTFIITFDLNFDFHGYTYVHHAAFYVFQYTAAPLAFAMFFLVTPIAAIYALVTKIIDARAARAARPVPPSLPVAIALR